MREPLPIQQLQRSSTHIQFPSTVPFQTVTSQRPSHLPPGMFQNLLSYSNQPIAGRLKYYLAVWHLITRDPWVLQVAQSYQIQFTSTPVQMNPPQNGRISGEDQLLIDQEVQELLAKQAVHSRAWERGWQFIMVQAAQTTTRGLSALFRSTQKGWGAQASYKPETPKQFCTLRAFQNGINTHAKRSFKKRRLFSENRLKGRIPDSTCLERPPEVPSISLEGLTSGVCMPSIRPCERSKSVHKAYETSPVSFATERHSTHSLPRRLSYNGRISTTCPTACGNSTKSFRGTGVCSTLSKVTVNTIPSDRVFGVRSKLCQYDLESPKGQNKESPSKLSTTTRQPSNFGSGVVKIPGPTIFVNSGSISCPTALLLPPTSQEFCPEKTEILRSSGQPRFRGPSGGSVVEKQSCCMEREGPTPTSDRPNNRNRCIPPGVGGPLPRSVNRGEMVATREHTSHKLPRAPSRVLSSQMFYQIQGKSPGTPAYGQCHSGNLHKQNGGHPLSPSVSTSQESVGLASQSQCIALSPVYSRDTEHTDRPRVEGIPRLQRLETEPNCFQQPVSEMGTSRHRPFRIPPDISIRPLCELETRPFGNTYGCVHPQLGDISGAMHFPPSQ